jgi:HD-like signal output (HDOD) protein
LSQAESENHYLQLLGRMAARKTLPPEDIEILKVLKQSKLGVSVLLEGMGLDSFLETRFMELSLQAKFFEIQPTHTLVQTVKAVGLLPSRNLTYAFFLIGHCFPEPPLDPVDFWLHSLTTALLSRELALLAGAEDDVEVFSAGLIHDMGKTYLQGMDPALYARVLEESWEARRPLKECEENAFGISHTAAGRRVWVGWSVPPVVSSLAAYHHRTWDKIQDVNVRRRSHAALWMGNVLAKACAIGQSGDETIPEVPKDIVSCLGLETERCLALAKKIESQVQSLLHIVLLHLPIESIRSARKRVSIPRLSSSLVYIDIEPPIVDPLVMTMRRLDPEARIVNRIDDVFSGQMGLAVFSIRSRKGVRLLAPVLDSLREQEVPCLLLSPPSLELSAGPERVVRSPFRVAELVQALHDLDAKETPESSE